MAEPLSFDELLAAAEQQDFISIAEKQAKELKPIREGLGYFSPKSLLGQGAALGQYGQGGVMDALGFGAALFNYPEFAAEAKKEAANFYKTGQSYGEDGGQGFYNISETEENPVSNLFFGAPPTLDERITDFVPTLGFEGGVEQEMSTEEEMTGMPGPIGGMSNAERVQEALFGATPAFEKSGRGKAPVKEERFFTGEGKPKPGEMMDTDFLNTFEEALLDTGESKGDKVTPETKEDLLAKYKKEFYDATGLDSSGKVDKSAALMALGLSLMQNKAGKGFNVGKMLSAVGEAGEKALPELTKAKDKAAAAQVAAGKYALGQIQAGKSASAALAKEQRATNLTRDLKMLELTVDAQKDSKSGLEVKSATAMEYVNGLKIRIGRNADGAKFFDPAGALVKTKSSWEKVNKALSDTAQVEDLLTTLSSSSSPTTNLIKDKMLSVAVGLGITNPEAAFGDKKIGLEQEIKVIGQSIIARYKKMLTQETGNGISNKDVERLEELLGNPKLFANPQEAILAIGTVRDIFKNKRQTISGLITQLQDPDMYALESEWEDNQEGAKSLTALTFTNVNSDSSNVPRIDITSNK